MEPTPEVLAIHKKFVADRDAKIIRPEWRLTPEEVASALATKTGVIAFVESKLTPREVEITNWTGAEAVKKMHGPRGDRTSIVEVVTSMCKRAALIHQICNTLVGW
jgi:hypothetical protein